MANEGREAQQKDEEIATRKRKADEEKVWEGRFFPRLLPVVQGVVLTGFLYPCSIPESREQRVDSWRSFTATGNKKRKKNKDGILG